MLFEMKCPSCSATMQFDDTRDSMFCPYCGNRVANIAEQININHNINVSGTVYHVQDRSNEPNLFISYNTIIGIGIIFSLYLPRLFSDFSVKTTRDTASQQVSIVAVADDLET